MTLREHLEAILDRHVKRTLDGCPPFDYCHTCSGHPKWPCPDYRDAVAALAILDASAKKQNADFSRRWRLVPDSEPSA